MAGFLMGLGQFVKGGIEGYDVGSRWEREASEEAEKKKDRARKDKFFADNQSAETDPVWIESHPDPAPPPNPVATADAGVTGSPSAIATPGTDYTSALPSQPDFSSTPISAPPPVSAPRAAIQTPGTDLSSVMSPPPDFSAVPVSAPPPAPAAPPPAATPDLQQQTATAYPYIKQFNPVVVYHPQEGEEGSETWPVGEEGSKEKPRPKDIPIDRVGIEIYKPDQVKPLDLAAEFLHVDPVANDIRNKLIPTFSKDQRAYLKVEAKDYGTAGNESPQKRMENATDSALRSAIFGQGGPTAFDKMNYTPEQQALISQLRDHVNGGGAPAAPPAAPPPAAPPPGAIDTSGAPGRVPPPPAIGGALGIAPGIAGQAAQAVSAAPPPPVSATGKPEDMVVVKDWATGQTRSVPRSQTRPPTPYEVATRKMAAHSGIGDEAGAQSVLQTYMAKHTQDIEELSGNLNSAIQHWMQTKDLGPLNTLSRDNHLGFEFILKDDGQGGSALGINAPGSVAPPIYFGPDGKWGKDPIYMPANEMMIMANGLASGELPKAVMTIASVQASVMKKAETQATIDKNKAEARYSTAAADNVGRSQSISAANSYETYAARVSKDGGIPVSRAQWDAANPGVSEGAASPGGVGSSAPGAWTFGQVQQGLVRRGVDPEKARGIAAGVMSESSGDPNAFNAAGGGQGAHGFGQWRGDRLALLQKTYGQQPTPDQQLDFLVAELKGQTPEKGGAAVLGATTARTVAENYIRSFARPGDDAEGGVKRAYTFLNGGGPPGVPGAMPTPGSGFGTEQKQPQYAGTVFDNPTKLAARTQAIDSAARQEAQRRAFAKNDMGEELSPAQQAQTYAQTYANLVRYQIRGLGQKDQDNILNKLLPNRPKDIGRGDLGSTGGPGGGPNAAARKSGNPLAVGSTPLSVRAQALAHAARTHRSPIRSKQDIDTETAFGQLLRIDPVFARQLQAAATAELIKMRRAELPT